MHLYMVMHMTLMSPTLNDPFTKKFPSTWWQRIHQVTQRPGMYRKLGVRFDSVTLMLWNTKVFSETSPPEAIVARDFIHLKMPKIGQRKALNNYGSSNMKLKFI